MSIIQSVSESINKAVIYASEIQRTENESGFKENKAFKIAMLGGSGVGKTSLLTAMYDQFEDTLGQTNLQLTPDLESAAILQTHLGELKSLLDEFITQGGIGGSKEERSFIFELGERGRKPSLKLEFRDFPGGYLDVGSTPKNKAFVEELVRQADVVVLPIDTPSLMEANGIWHQKVNRPRQITELFERTYRDLKNPKLVILAPVRCETYLKAPKKSSDLLKKVKDEYDNLLKVFQAPALSSSVATVITPVQTLGNVVLSPDVENKTPIFRFRKTGHGAVYEPQDSDQPLRYILRFILYLKYRRANPELFARRFRDIFGLNEYLKRAAIEAAKGCKTKDGFAILQGYEFLNLELN